MHQDSNPIIRRLQVVFAISVILLLSSSYASFYSIQKLIDRSNWVNHTHTVININQDLLQHIIDAEASQRAYLITHSKTFIPLFNSALDSTYSNYRELKSLTSDNASQQQNLATYKSIIDQRVGHLRSILDMDIQHEASQTAKDEGILIGAQLMQKLKAQFEIINNEEQSLLRSRSSDQTKFSTYTPILILVASILSILITMASYIRIKADLDERMAQQAKTEQKYKETSERITKIESVTRQIANGDYTVRSDDHIDDDLGRISHAMNDMVWSLQKSFSEISERSWLQQGAVVLSESMRGQMQLGTLADNITKELANYTQAQVGALYVVNDASSFRLSGCYSTHNAPQILHLSDGITGQAIRDRQIRLIHDLPVDYLSVSSTLGRVASTHLLAIPLVYGRDVVGIIELGYIAKPTELTLSLINETRESMAIAINSVINFRKTQDLLEKTQAQSEELQSQHAELENMNSELEAQTQKLQASEEELKVQQEELMQTNQELEERSKQLEEQSQLIFDRNIEIQKKAEQLALSTKYKSEFLANMSHELRTPLNSILLLSRLMSENMEKNLTTEQVEYAQVIQGSGASLLTLIDEILDLSKIESGKMSIEFLPVTIDTIVSDIRPLFEPLAREKKISFEVNVQKNITSFIETDQIRLEQILKNLLSNAMKFTSKGGVSLTVSADTKIKDNIIFKVKDTGIGIATDKQELIFEAFQQADGSTRRKFGGTGLGLSISRELSKLLGGSISVSSVPGEGSEFAISVPVKKSSELEVTIENNEPDVKMTSEDVMAKTQKPRYISENTPQSIPDDRDNIKDGDKVVLIVEDDTNFAAALLEYTRRQGYKGVVAVRGDEGIKFALAFMPVAILLDIQLPVKDGWEVMEELKNNGSTRHIPVHIMSSYQMRKESLLKGAVDFINKPVAFEQMPEIFRKLEHVIKKKDKKVLIIEENNKHAQALSYFLQSYAVNSEIKNSINDSVSALMKDDVDCVILDMGVPDHSGYKMLEEVKKNPGLENLPVIVFTGKSLSKNDEQKIKTYADSIVVKTAHSYQRILDEVSIFLHLLESNKKKAGNKFTGLGALSEVLKDKKILIVDDDIRNIYAMTHALEQYKVNVISATDGKEALHVLDQNQDTNIVLMDIMMPEMDGYEAIRKIRQDTKYISLPVIAVTAKAMIGDRDKCIQAGASDYISKPIDIDQLMSLLRVWLYGQ